MGLLGSGLTRIFSPISRLVAFLSSIIVAGIAGAFMRKLHHLNMPYGSKLTYVVALAGLSIVFSLLLMAPFKFSFWAFPLDFAFFVMWMVAFGLLANLSGGCGTRWYRFIWTFAWRGRHCNTWRTLLAFSFLSSIMWLINSLLGAYKTFTGKKEPRDPDRERGFGKQKRLSHGSSVADPPMSQPRTSQPTGAAAYNNAATRNTATTHDATHHNTQHNAGVATNPNTYATDTTHDAAYATNPAASTGYPTTTGATNTAYPVDSSGPVPHAGIHTSGLHGQPARDIVA